MSKGRLEIKVGLFVIVGLVLGALTIIQFNKSAGPLTKTYRIHLVATNSAGVIPGSTVMMSGVPIGHVEEIELLTDTGTTLLHAKLLQKYPVRTNSVFVIRQSGFLGDQYIAVLQNPDTKAKQLKDGDNAICEASFDFGEAAKTATGLLANLNGMLAKVSNVVDRVDNTLLATNVLLDLQKTILNLREVSAHALTAADKVNALLDTNGPAINGSVSNAQTFTVQLNGLASDLRTAIATNRDILTASLSNLRTTTENLNSTMADLQAGKGPAGALLKDQQIARDLSLITSNLQVLSSNINNKGLWKVLREPKTPKK
jgi:phospholipid/cholesterol/gamma-HCH transport system substrate-binding protein